MELVVSGDDLLGANRLRAAAVVGYEATRFAHEQAAGSRVPRLQMAFPEPVESPGSHPGKVERGRAEAANSRDLRPDGREDSRPFGKIPVRVVGNAGGNQRVA